MTTPTIMDCLNAEKYQYMQSIFGKKSPKIGMIYSLMSLLPR